MGKEQVRMKTVDEISAEISALHLSCADYDTGYYNDNVTLAVGAHDALRWALGLAEQSISEFINSERIAWEKE